MDEIRPASIPITGIMGGLSIHAAAYMHGWGRDALFTVGVVLACFAITTLFFWGRDIWIDQNVRIWSARDRIYALAVEAHGMTSEQIQFVKNAANIGTDRSLEGEVFLRGTDAPMWFVAEFLSRSFTYRLCPVRNYSEGTDERRWAQAITAVLINGGYALCAIGNSSAPFAEGVTPDIIAGKLGIELRADPPSADGYTPLPGGGG